MKKPTKTPKPYRTTQRYGILNPYGDLWSPCTFETEGAAMQYVVDFWRGVKGQDLSKYRAVRVRTTVSALR